MRLITMNLWGTRGEWDARRAALREGLGDLRPDILALQETIVTDQYDQVRDLLGEDFEIVHQTKRESDGQGISIASRWPLDEVRELDLQLSDRTADFACTTLLARIAAPFGAFLVANHFPSWKLDMEAEREVQSVIAARAVEESVVGTDMPAIVAGDLDADPASASIRFWTGRQSLDGMSVCYRDAWESIHPGAPGHTYTPNNDLMTADDWPFRRIDYILVRFDESGPALTIDDCRLIFDKPVGGVWASDHFGLAADLTPRRT